MGRDPGEPVAETFPDVVESDDECSAPPAGHAGRAGRAAAYDAARTVLDTHFPELPRLTRRSVLFMADGDPLALTVLARVFGPAPHAPGTGHRFDGDHATPLAALSPWQRWLALLMALDCGGSMTTVWAAAGVDDTEGHLRVLEERGLVEIDGSRFAFRHPVLRAAVVSTASAARRRQAHRALARVQTELGLRVWHLAESAIGRDDGTARQLAAAARQSGQQGNTVAAAEALVRAAEVSHDPGTRADLMFDAATWEWLGGRLARATGILAAVARYDLAPGEHAFYEAAAVCLLAYRTGDADAALDLLAGIVRDDRCRPAHRSRALGMMAELIMFGGTDEHKTTIAEAMAGGITEVPDPVRWHHGATTLPRTDRHGPANGMDYQSPLQLARAAMEVDAFDRCRGLLVGIVARPGDARIARMRGLALLSVSSHASGRWDEAERQVRMGIDIADARRYDLFGNLFRAISALLAAMRGREEEADELARAVLRWATPRRLWRAASVAWWARTEVAMSRGDYDEAYENACQVVAPGALSGGNPAVSRWVTLNLAESAVRSGRPAMAVARARLLRDARVHEVSGRMALVVAGAEALAAPADTARELFERALATHGARAWPYEYARIELAYGQWLRRRTRVNGLARERLRSAMTAFDGLGAESWAGRARDELRAAGQAPPREGTGPALLTPQERMIAELAATGLSNKQIGARLTLSHRTVSGHLYRIFPKLGISSRAALRDALIDAGIMPAW